MLFILIVAIAISLASAEQRCQKDSNGVQRYNGKPCASTTRYDDGHRGACGCGPPNSDTPFNWNLGDFVTAPNQKVFDDGGDGTWCGRNCGRCVRLTPTGGFVPGKGRAPGSTASRIFMITNDCPIAENREWCGQSGKPGTNAVNTYGYEAHFDLQDNKGQVSNTLGWDNPEVTWEWVNCPGDFSSKWNQCECH